MSKLSIVKGIVENRIKIFETDHTAPADIQPSGSVRKFYKITVGGRTFNATSSLGKQIVSGKEIVVVLDRSEAVMLRDVETGKISGFVGSWVVLLTSIATLIFNFLMIPVCYSDNSLRNLVVLLSVNIFLAIILIVAISYFLKERKAKALLDSEKP